jgi:hypothetical protein
MSLFGKKSSDDTKEVGLEVNKTGLEVDNVITALLVHAHDKDEAVKNQANYTILELGVKQSPLVISSISTFLYKNPKLDSDHRVQLLRLLIQLLESQRKNIEESLSLSLIKFLSREMTSDHARDNTELQNSCSTGLVLLAQLYCNQVIDDLLSLSKPGELPHYYVIKTLADAAIANPLPFTLRLKDILSRLTPVLALCKKPGYQWVFACAFGRFCEALQHFTANATEQHTVTLSVSSFELDMLSAFDVLFSQWLNSTENKVRFAVAESLGHMSSALEKNAFDIRFPKLIAKYLELYKKEKFADHLHISVGFYGIIRRAVANPQLLEQNNQFNLVLANLHPLICKPVDFNVPNSQKNQNELLRIFEILARAELDLTLNFIINRFQLKERDVRVGSIILLRHLVNAMSDQLVDKQPYIMSSVCGIIGENDISMKKLLLQLITSMSNQGYLALEGGQILVKFVIQQSALAVDESDAKSGDILTLRKAASHLLVVMASKVQSTQKTLWPYLFEFVCDEQYSRAILTLFKAIEALAAAKRELNAADYKIQWELNVNLPPPQAILARLFVLAADPYKFSKNSSSPEAGLVYCRCLVALGPILNPAAASYWDEAVAVLLEYLETSSVGTAKGSEEEDINAFSLAKWQDTLLKVWKETLTKLEPVKFLHDLTTSLSEQFKLYKGDSGQLRIVQRYLGALLARIESKALIQTALDVMLNALNSKSEQERQGLAQGLGLAATAHIDTVLTRVTDRLTGKDKGKADTAKKSSGFFASLTNSEKEVQGPDELTQAALVLSYGYIAAYAPVEQVLSRLEVHVTHNLLNAIPRAKSLTLRLNLIKTVDFIGKSIHPSRLPEGKQNYKLSQRDELLLGVAALLQDAQLPSHQASFAPSSPANGSKKPDKSKEVPIKPVFSSELRLLGLNSLSTLVNLEPPLKLEVRQRLSEVVFPYFGLDRAILASDDAKLAKESAALAATTSPAQAKHAENATSGHVESKTEAESVSLELIVESLNSLLQYLLNREPSVAILTSILALLDPWLTSTKPVERSRACETYLILLKKFVQRVVHDRIVQNCAALPDLGRFLSSLLVRCSDCSMSVRQSACETVQALLYVNQVLGNLDNPKPQQEIKLISEIKGRLTESNNFELRVVVLNDLAVLINEILVFDQLVALLQALFAGLVDTDNEAAQGTAVIFTKIIELRGNNMTAGQVKALVESFVLAAKLIKREQVKSVCESALRRLTTIHFAPILVQLVELSVVPISKELSDCWLSISNAAEDAALAQQILLHLIRLINDTPLEKDKATPIVQTAVQALNHILKQQNSAFKALLKSPDIYPALFSTLLMRIGTAQPIGGSSLADSVAALRSFLEASAEDDMLYCREQQGTWAQFASELYDDGITGCTKFFCEIANHSAMKVPVLEFLARFYNQQSHNGQRIVATAMLAEFVNHARDDLQLISQLIKHLLPRVVDKTEKVRKHGIRGLGNLVSVWSRPTIEMASAILSSLTTAAEDATAEVAAEAVAALTKICAVIDAETIEPQLQSICFRLKPSFDRKEDNVRAAAFALFGQLSRFGRAAGSNQYNDNFMENFHANLPILLVHLNDEVSSVRNSVLKALQQLAALMEPELATLITDGYVDNAASFDEFFHNLAPLLSKSYDDKLRGYLDVTGLYFGSKWNVVRGNAAIVAAELLHNSSAHAKKTINVSAMVTALIKLLDESNAAVRGRTVKALALLYDV